MKLLVSVEEHYISARGRIYSSEGTTPYEFFRRSYLKVFDQVVVLARVCWDERFVGRPEAISDGPNVEFFSLPDFRGPFQYVPVRSRLLAHVREAIRKADAYLLRGPGVIGNLLASEVQRAGQSYAAQVLGDPWEVFGPGRVGGFLRWFYRPLMTERLKRICWKAAAVSYVTRSTLQRRYPASAEAFAASWSDAQIEGAIATEGELEKRIRSISELANRPAVLGFIGSLEQPYKGADLLLRAVAACRLRGFKVVAHLVGDGRLLSQYQHLAQELGVADYVKFLGRLGASGPIFQFLDSVDLFVMPSLTEGLPRAMIEAMARGCPCIGSNVGGIPELLAPEDLVRSGDPFALAKEIMQKLASQLELARMARRNRAMAKNYDAEHAQTIESAFLNAIRNQAIAGTNKSFAEDRPLGIRPASQSRSCSS